VIVTFTAHPTLERSATLDGPFTPGAVHFLQGVTVRPAGRGVAVSMVVHRAGRRTLAILPGDPDGPLAPALQAEGVPSRLVPTGTLARSSLSITDADGATMVFRDAGLPLTPENTSALVSAVMAACPGSSWLVLGGPLPAGAPVDWYVRLIQTARQVGVRVAVDSFGPALDAVLATLPDGAPDLLVAGVGALTQATAMPVEVALELGEHGPALAAARSLCTRGAPVVLAPLRTEGALLVTRDAAWYAHPDDEPPADSPRTKDAALAGYLLGSLDGADQPGCLARAVAYATAAARLTGPGVPSPADVERVAVTVTRLR